MLSYQHSYHAGCFADVMKHAILTRLLTYLTQKENPLLYLDTHAGRGRYDLRDKHALKTNEAESGIQTLWAKRDQLSPLFLPYINSITELNADYLANNPSASKILRYYPGSPEIAIQLLREQDRLVLCELHPREFEHLRELRRRGRRVIYKDNDGLGIDNITTFLPPMERRGLVFTDPSYEVKTEYQTVVKSIKAAYNRCPTMTYCLWYPLINDLLPAQLLKNLQSIDSKNYLRLEFHMNQKPAIGMTGSGLWIINPPYTLREEARIILKELTKVIQPETASFLVE